LVGHWDCLTRTCGKLCADGFPTPCKQLESFGTVLCVKLTGSFILCIRLPTPCKQCACVRWESFGWPAGFCCNALVCCCFQASFPQNYSGCFNVSGAVASRSVITFLIGIGRLWLIWLHNNIIYTFFLLGCVCVREAELRKRTEIQSTFTGIKRISPVIFKTKSIKK
jgi:hypothetical protein